MTALNTNTVASAERLSLKDSLLIAVAKLHTRVGLSGCVGIALIIASIAICAWTTREKQAFKRSALAPVVHPIEALAPVPQAALQRTTPSLPRSADSVRLIKLVKGIVQAHGLAWPQAEYRLAPLSDESLSTLEIRTTLKGSYPKLRQTIAALLDKEPALGLRELTLTRPNADTPDVEAKVRWVVFLADGWPALDEENRQ